jgi:hypothetical protein
MLPPFVIGKISRQRYKAWEDPANIAGADQSLRAL